MKLGTMNASKKTGYLEYSVGCFLCASDSKVSGKILMSRVTRLLVENNSSLFMVHVIVLCICVEDIVPLPFLFFENF